MTARLGWGMLLLVAGLGGGALTATAPDIVAAILVLQLPGMLALLFDPTRGRAVGRTVLLFQAAASVRPIAAIWFKCDGIRQCFAMATGTRTILSVLCCGALGFLLTQTLPALFKLFDDAQNQARLRHLSAQREKLVAEWELYG